MLGKKRSVSMAVSTMDPATLLVSCHNASAHCGSTSLCSLEAGNISSAASSLKANGTYGAWLCVGAEYGRDFVRKDCCCWLACDCCWCLEGITTG